MDSLPLKWVWIYSSFLRMEHWNPSMATLSPMDLTVKSALNHLAEEEEAAGNMDEDKDEHNDESDLEDQEDDSGMRELLERIKTSPDGNEGQDDQETSNQMQMDMLQEFVESYEANHSGSADSSEKELATRAAAEIFHADADDHVEDATWATEQESELMEKERDKIESEVAVVALASGAKIQGQAFLRIAEEYIADTCLNLEFIHVMSPAVL